MSRYVFGYHAIEELLKKGAAASVLLISRRNERIESIRALALRAGVLVSEMEEGELSRICGSTAHKGAVLAVEKPRAASSDLRGWLSELDSDTALVLVLDHVTDPQNLGAILRSADQFRADLVILPSRRSAQENQTVARVSSGANQYVPLMVIPNIASALELLKKGCFWIYGADVSGEPAHGAGLKGRVSIVMGSEGEGLRRLVRERCDALLRIPTGGHVDSLNVSAAAAVLMYEVRRQQGFPF
jgi:23S rRNA (guanosine2251-2'-O)-methyltransferase